MYELIVPEGWIEKNSALAQRMKNCARIRVVEERGQDVPVLYRDDALYDTSPGTALQKILTEHEADQRRAEEERLNVYLHSMATLPPDL